VAPLNKSAAYLAHMLVEAVVWHEHVDDELGPTLAQVSRRTLQMRFADSIRRSSRIPQAERSRFAELCEVEPPPNDVASALRLLPLTPRHAEEMLREITPPETPHPVDYLLSWLRLLYVCDRSRNRVKEFVLAARVGRSVRALQVNARARTGLPLHVARSQPESVLARAHEAFSLR
jgi:hypothetical protein